MTASPTGDELLGYFDQLSNWGRWGNDDELGTLNLVTPEVRKAAAALVSEGITVSCAWDIETTPQLDYGTPPQRHMLRTGEGLNDPDRVLPPGVDSPPRSGGAMEHLSFTYHGYAITHIDGLSHQFWDGQMYNGVPAARVTAAEGATRHAITALRDGIMTRGALLDIPASQGRSWLDAGEGVRPEDLEQAEARQNVRVRQGDAVLLRTGYGRRKMEQGREPPASPLPGWHPASLPWLHERGVAMIGADVPQDVHPSGYEEHGMRLPVHSVGMVAMGLWLIDNCNLEELAATCERLGRYEFQFMLSPLRMEGGTGSPANPLAIF